MAKKNKSTTKKPKRAPQNEVEEISDDLGNAVALQAIHDSEGGQLLIDGLVSDIIGAIDTMIGAADTITHIQYVTLACKMKERIDLVRVLTGAKANREVLEDILAEALKKEKENPPTSPSGA